MRRAIIPFIFIMPLSVVAFMLTLAGIIGEDINMFNIGIIMLIILGLLTTVIEVLLYKKEIRKGTK